MLAQTPVIEGRLYITPAPKPAHGEVFLALDGKLRHVPSSEVFKALWSVHFPNPEMIQVTLEDLSNKNYPIGQPLHSHAFLFATENGQIWLKDTVPGHTKENISWSRRIESIDVLKRYGFDPAKVKKPGAYDLYGSAIGQGGPSIT